MNCFELYRYNDLYVSKTAGTERELESRRKLYRTYKHNNFSLKSKFITIMYFLKSVIIFFHSC